MLWNTQVYLSPHVFFLLKMSWFHVLPILQANPRMTLFTGSSRVAEKLALDLKGRIRLEDAGFDWKVLGPDVQEVPYYIFYFN